MPSPLGHALAGAAIAAATARDATEARSLSRAAVIVGCALAPDLDLLLKFLDGQNHHQTESHSLGAAILAGVLVACASRLLGVRRPLALGLAASLAWLSHVALDYMGRDTHPPIGIMALWPLSREHFNSPWPIFLDIGRNLTWPTLRHNVLAITWELTLLVPGASLILWRRFGT
jgi:membrane-bound metal-dependent hydrolase YbcI (DUF457 family)